MDMDLVILGTSASAPSARRGLSSMLLRRGGERILFDCGEGTQRQLMRSVGLSDIDAILITHAHADHVFGLPGMLKTFGLRERELPLMLVGPPGFRREFATLARLIGRLPYELDVQEAGDAWLYEGDGYKLTACETEHSVSSVGFKLTEYDRPGRFDLEHAQELGVPHGPMYGLLQRGNDVTLDDGTLVRSADVVGQARSGRTIVYSGDTQACPQMRDFATRANVLVHEATFLTEDADKAADTLHSTARQAALLAAAADVDQLVLTHLSTRYPARAVRAEAREVFPDTHIASDFDLITVPYPENGDVSIEPKGARQRQAAAASVPAAASSAASTGA